MAASVLGLDPSYMAAIQGFEGYAPTAKWDYKQYTNGYGTKAQYPGETIDKATASDRFNTAIGQAAGQVDKFAPNLPAGARAALTDLTYNAGSGWMNSGLGQAVKNGNWGVAAQLMQQYDKAGGQVLPGLASRRATDASWLMGNAPNTPQATQVAQNTAPMGAGPQVSSSTAASTQPQTATPGPLGATAPILGMGSPSPLASLGSLTGPPQGMQAPPMQPLMAPHPMLNFLPLMRAQANLPSPLQGQYNFLQSYLG